MSDPREPASAAPAAATPEAATGATPEAVARAKFHCPACGAEANWNPAKQKLICPFCGTESPASMDTSGGTATIV